MKYIQITILLFITTLSFGQKLTIEVAGECGMCKDRIEETALSTIGVETAVFNLKTKILTVQFVEGLFNEEELHQNIASAGHDTNKVKAKKEVYDALPMCCQYRVEERPKLTGMVYEIINGEKTPLIGANIHWADTGRGTITGEVGDFSLPLEESSNQLIVSYIGYDSDTLQITQPGNVEILLDNSITLNTIEVVYKKGTTEISFLDPIKTKKISKKELTKAACCNLSESFDTNPSIDVSFTDAVTGTKQIEMLGLAGPYVQITREGMPDIRGLSSLDGFTFIPGPWIQGIQMNFGTGSVINGFESVAGQINVELKKPEDEEKLHLNGYANVNGRLEANAISTFEVTDRLRSAVLFHGDIRALEADRNDDGFLDNPKSKSLIFSNRWRWDNYDGQEGQFGFKSTLSNREGGTLSDNPIPWTSNSDINRHEIWLKRGMVFKDKPYASLGFMLSGIYHDLNSNYGSRNYNGTQRMIYANLLYSTIISDTDHKITFGASFQGEQYDEDFGEYSFDRKEYVPGVFAEYSYSIFEKFDAVVGLRGDYNNYYGAFVTPRLHLRYAPNENHVFRLIGGRGQRTANVFAENVKAMATNRSWIIHSEDEDKPYGLDAEVAWNYGANYTFLFNVKNRLQTFGIDYYFTDFSNQIVVDYDIDPRAFHVSNLTGKSYSHSIQGQFDIDPLDGFSVRLAYRYNIVNTTLAGELRSKPLVAPHRGFANFAYETRNGWKFDYTVNVIGTKRLPITTSSPSPFQLEARSPSFWMHNVQISKVFNDKFEVYVGGENIADFRQANPIVSSENPQNAYFDASMVWGPIFGRNIYVGFRYTLLKEDEQ